MNKFEIQIVALDKATKVFQKINNHASQTVRPLVQAQRKLGVLARTAHLPAIGRGLQNAAQGAAALAQNLGLSTGPMAALLGGGALAGVAALVGGLTALTARWAGMTFQMDRTAQTYGLNVQGLQRLRGAADLLKIPVSEVDTALAGLSQRLRLAAIQDPSAAQLSALMAKLGIAMRKTKDGTVDTGAVLEDLSRAIVKVQNPLTQLAIAEEAGVAALLPLLKQGPDAIRKLADESANYGNVQGPKAIKTAEEFTAALQRLKQALEGVGNKIGETLAPGITGGMDRLTDRITGKRPWLTVPSIADVKKSQDEFARSRSYLFSGGGLFGDPKPKGRRVVSGKVTQMGEGGANGEPADMAPDLGIGTPQYPANLDRAIRSGATFTPGVIEALNRMHMQSMRDKANVTVTVEVPNAPPGVRVRASSDSANVPVRISRPMPGSAP